MTEYEGTIEFEYYGRVISFEYTMNNLGGSPHIYFKDKHGKYHDFFCAYGTWNYGRNVKLKWRADFVDVLFRAFDLAREKHRL